MDRRKWLDLALETASVAILAGLVVGLSLFIFFDVARASGPTVYDQPTIAGPSATTTTSMNTLFWTGNGAISRARIYVPAFSQLIHVFAVALANGAYGTPAKSNMPANTFIYTEQCEEGTDEKGNYYNCYFSPENTYTVIDYTGGNATNYYYFKLCGASTMGSFICTGIPVFHNGVYYSALDSFQWTGFIDAESVTSSFITPLAPASGITSETTSVSFSANYFYNPALTDAIMGFSYDSFSLRLSRVDTASSSEISYGVTANALITETTVLTLPENSAWTYFWCFSGQAPWGPIDGQCTATRSLFVTSNPIPLFLGVDDLGNLSGLATSTCGITNLSGCVQNAMAFLFYPSPTVLDQYKTLQTHARTRAPFGYVFMLLSSAQSVKGNSAPAFVLNIDPAIQTAYFNPLKAGIAVILWALASFWFFKRIRDLQL